MTTKIERWGKGLGVRIPDALARRVRVAHGMTVRLNAEAGRLVVTPVQAGMVDLKSLLAEVTPANLHQEVEFGRRTGQEIW